jgi:hypothetical protein
MSALENAGSARIIRRSSDGDYGAFTGPFGRDSERTLDRISVIPRTRLIFATLNAMLNP